MFLFAHSFNKLKMCLPGIGMVYTPVPVSDGQT